VAESHNLGEVVETLRSWSEHAGLAKAALAEYRQQYPDTRELYGIPLRDVRPVYVGQSLQYHNNIKDPPGGVPSVRVLYALELKKPPAREYREVGSFEVSYKLDGSVWSCKVHFDRERMHLVAEVRRNLAEGGQGGGSA
jgi:hypothetical protein